MKCLYLIFIIITSSFSVPVENKKEIFYGKITLDILDFVIQNSDFYKKAFQIENDIKPTVKYIINTHNEEFKNAFEEAYKTKEFLKLSDYLKDFGINLREMLEVVDMDSNLNAELPTPSEQKRLENFVEELNEVTDFKKIKEFWDKKLKYSPSYKEFYEDYKTKKTQDLVNNFFQNPETLKLFKTHEKYGIPLSKYMDYAFKIILP